MCTLLSPVHFQHFQECLLMVIDWTPITGTIPCQIQSEPVHGPWCREVQSAFWRVVCFSLSSGMLNRTSSHVCGSWHLLVFLFRDGSYTLMNIGDIQLHDERQIHWAQAIWVRFIKHISTKYYYVSDAEKMSVIKIQAGERGHTTHVH